MARGRDQRRRLAEQETARRRQSAAHRSLRRRAERGKGAHVASAGRANDADAVAEDRADAPVETAPEADDAPVVEERTPTSELKAPLWLAEESDAAPLGGEQDADADGDPEPEPVPAWAQTDDEPYSPAYVPAPRPEQEPAAAPEPASASADDTAVLEPVGARDTGVMDPVEEPTSTDLPVVPAVAAAPEPDDDSEKPSRAGRRTFAVLALVVVTLGVLYVGAQALLSDTVPRDTQVLGVSIGGMSATQATGVVGERADELASGELALEAAGETYVTTPAAAGLGVDAQATIDELTGFTVLPQRLWMHVTGGGTVEPVAVVEEDELDRTVTEAALALDRLPLDAGVSIDGGIVDVVPGQPAVVVDRDASAELIAAAWPTSDTVVLVAAIEDPDITDADAEAFAEDLRTEALGGPVTLTGDDAEAVVDAPMLASASRVVADGGSLSLEIDGAALADAIIAANPDLTTEGEDASVEFTDDHEIVKDPGLPGITLDAEALGAAVETAARVPARTAELPYTAADPDVSAEALGLDDFQEVVASFDTPLTAEPIRTQNLRTAAADVEGTILQPGDEFNLHDILSPITQEEGYADAHVIVDGILTSGIGGGLSQMATTSYNAAYFAGYELLQHRPHSVWFTRYPAGRESTLWGSTINVRFVNSTPYAAIINSYIDGGRLHVDIWSTPHFEVETIASPKTNIQEPGVKEVKAANCEAKGPGQPGFTITNTRRVFLEDEMVDESSSTWTYLPDDAIKCVSDDDEDGDEGS